MASGDVASLAVTGPASRGLARFDASRLVLYAFAALLFVLVIMPMTWLAIYAFTDRTRSFTLANFQRLFTEAAFIDPLLITFTVAVCSSIICCAIAAPMGWLVARTDMPFSRIIRALVTASFVTPPFLGAIAWELLAAPNSGLLNKFFRFLTGAPQDEYLFNIYTLPRLIFVIACYTFPYVFVLFAN